MMGKWKKHSNGSIYKKVAPRVEDSNRLQYKAEMRIEVRLWHLTKGIGEVQV